MHNVMDHTNYIYIYIYTVMNTTILQLVAIYKIQLHVSALYVGHHQGRNMQLYLINCY